MSRFFSERHGFPETQEELDTVKRAIRVQLLRTMSETVADEAISEAIAALIRRANEGAVMVNWRSYLQVCARRAGIRMVSRNRERRIREKAQVNFRTTAVEEPADQAEKAESLTRIREEVGKLPEPDRLLLKLRFEQNSSLREIASKLDERPSSVHRRLAAILNRLWERLRD